jgi:hypothetical protein
MLFDSWLWILVSILWWLPQNVQHEGAHVVAYRAAGAEITEFVVYPTNQAGDFSLKFWVSGFSWAHMRARYSSPDRTRLANAMTAIGPQLTNTLLLIALILVWPMTSGLVAAVLTGLYVNNFVDGAVNLSSYYRPEPADENKHTDAWKFQRVLGLNRWFCRGCTALWQTSFALPLILA